MQCGQGCAPGRGASLAFTKYDCSCDGACGACCSGAHCGSAVDGCDSYRDAANAGCLGRALACHGCGELYWNEWHNAPPALCQPCDCLGNYTGPGAAGYYRAPYRRHDALTAGASWGQPPLELAQRGEDAVR